jgi:flagellar assembly protein FliH
MNLSNVLKHSEGFVPEKIIEVDIDQAPVWGQLAKKVEESSAVYTQDHAHKETDSTAILPESSRVSTGDTNYPFDSDFSSPDREVAQSATISPPSEEAPPSPSDPIDLDALAEEHYNKGVQAGIERMESDYGLAIRTLQTACEQLNTVRENILKNSLKEMQELVLQIAEKIIRQSLDSQKETIRKTVEESLQKAVKSEEFIVHVNPDDYETIKSHSAEFIQSINGLENLLVKKDTSIEKGGCLVESNNCTVDATLTSQMEVISDFIKDK